MQNIKTINRRVKHVFIKTYRIFMVMKYRDSQNMIYSSEYLNYFNKTHKDHEPSS